jgi:hypothetical protein
MHHGTSPHPPHFNASKRPLTLRSRSETRADDFRFDSAPTIHYIEPIFLQTSALIDTIASKPDIF